MIESDNIDLIVSKITELVESREKREFMGKNARESIKRFDQRKITDRIKKVYLLTGSCVGETSGLDSRFSRSGDLSHKEK